MLLGKPNWKLMQETLRRLSGREDYDVLVGPKQGSDVSVLRLTQDRVMVSSTDPISFIPQLGAEDSATLSVHGVASDVATSSMLPRYALFDLNLPPSMPDSLLRKYWVSIHKACRDLGVAILGGHTGRFQGCNFSIVGGATMLAFGKSDRYVTSSMARDGDDIIATKSAALEAAVVLARCFPKMTTDRLGKNVQERCASRLSQISTVIDAIVASSLGVRSNGVTAMHDVTEGGTLSAASEVAKASRLSITIDADQIPIYDDVRQVCALFKIDPLRSLGQGSLLISSRPGYAAKIMQRLRSRRIDSAIIGKLTRRAGHNVIVRDGRTRTLVRSEGDPYWRAYWSGIRKRLS
ncbi:hypothetical protein AUG19_01035 [archaeon 13_1_20CM_2_54_9]|nr:MAG: hypothetical protein AUG19_01035 [archaeon 13_1_20CM_2_54_9]